MWVTLTLHTLSEPLPRPQLHACNKSMHAEEIFWDCQTFVSWLNKVRTEETKYRLHTFQKGAWNRERQRERDAEPHTNKAKKNKKKYKKTLFSGWLIWCITVAMWTRLPSTSLHLKCTYSHQITRNSIRLWSKLL